MKDDGKKKKEEGEIIKDINVGVKHLGRMTKNFIREEGFLKESDFKNGLFAVGRKKGKKDKETDCWKRIQTGHHQSYGFTMGTTALGWRGGNKKQYKGQVERGQTNNDGTRQTGI